jgi:hypothetical protein
LKLPQECHGALGRVRFVMAIVSVVALIASRDTDWPVVGRAQIAILIACPPSGRFACTWSLLATAARHVLNHWTHLCGRHHSCPPTLLLAVDARQLGLRKRPCVDACFPMYPTLCDPLSEHFPFPTMDDSASHGRVGNCEEPWDALLASTDLLQPCYEMREPDAFDAVSQTLCAAALISPRN